MLLYRFAKDLTAGLIVSIVALSLAIIGVSPENGLVTAIVAVFILKKSLKLIQEKYHQNLKFSPTDKK